LNRFIGHFTTITRHRHQVIWNCARAGIFWQGLWHDLSKYSLAEFAAGVKYYEGTHSPNEGERRAIGYSLAWMHHKGRNKHHFEYWNDVNPASHLVEPVKMPLRYVVEMFCDRVAASKTYMKEQYSDTAPFAYFERGHAGRFMHPETSAFLEKLLRMLDERGEKETFAYIRKIIRQKKEY